METMDTGRLYINAGGEVAKQIIKQVPGVVGAVASNNVASLQQLSQEQLQETDCLGRSAAMLAAHYRSWEALNFLLQSPLVINWLQVRSVINTTVSLCHALKSAGIAVTLPVSHLRTLACTLQPKLTICG